MGSVGHLNRRRVLHAAAGLGAWASLGACAPRTPVRVGFLGGLSGRVSDLGIGGRNGAQLAIDELNAAGGIDGQPVELLVHDDEQNDTVARGRMAALFDAGVRLIVGPMTSSVAVAVVPLANQRGIPVVSPTSTTHELSGRDDAFFRVVPDAPTGAAHETEHLVRHGTRRLATVVDLNNRAFSESWAKAAVRRLGELGGQTALELTFASQPGVAYAELAQRAASSGADTVLLVTNAADAAVIAQQLHQRRPDIGIATSPWAGTEQLIQMGGRSVEGALVAQYFDRDSQASGFLRFVALHRQRFGEFPGYPAVNAYDATMFGARALRERGAGVLATLRGIRSHDGLQRTFAIDEHGDSRAPMFLTRIRDGRYVAAGA